MTRISRLVGSGASALGLIGFKRVNMFIDAFHGGNGLSFNDGCELISDVLPMLDATALVGLGEAVAVSKNALAEASRVFGYMSDARSKALLLDSIKDILKSRADDFVRESKVTVRDGGNVFSGWLVFDGAAHNLLTLDDYISLDFLFNL